MVSVSSPPVMVLLHQMEEHTTKSGSPSPSSGFRMDGGDSSLQPEQVMSDVHIGCPPHFSGPYISRFTISLPLEVEPRRYNELFKAEAAALNGGPVPLNLDRDGDLVLPRRIKSSPQCFSVTIQHNITSSIPSVGLQLWKAELVLSDFVMHKMCTSSEFNGIVSIELGAGTGMVGILLARVAQTVFLTDRGDEILDNCTKNIQLNSGVFNCQGSVHVRELDWMNPWPPKVNLGDSASQEKLFVLTSRYSWHPSELEEVKRASLLLAADVIYSNDLTDAFFDILERLMSIGSEKILYLALEKRYNFSLDDLDVVANGYSHFRTYLTEEEECESLECGSMPCFVGKRIDFDEIPQYVREYNRGSDVELWRIKYNRIKS